MGIDNGPAYRQSHPRSAGLGGVKRLENALEMFRINARSRIAYCDEDAILLALLGTDQQLTCPGLDRAHCVDGVQD